MEWNPLQTEAELDALIQQSNISPCLIYKHSSRCSLSYVARSRLESRAKDLTGISLYLIDLIKNRNISNLVAEKLYVHHESPQIILVEKEECILDNSHLGIRVDEILEVLKDSPLWTNPTT